MTGTTHHTQCGTCGNYTVDKHGDCHYAYCGIEIDEPENTDSEINIPHHMLGADGIAMVYGIED